MSGGIMQGYGEGLAFLMVVSLLGGGQVWLSHLRLENHQQLQAVTTDIAHVNEDIQKLRVELSSLTRPELLRSMAEKKLGMHSPLPMQVIRP